MEDELQRIKLEGNIDTPKFVTGGIHIEILSVSNISCISVFLLCNEMVFPGSVIAIMGAEKNDGKFTVEDFCMADLPPQTPRQPPSSDRYRDTSCR